MSQVFVRRCDRCMGVAETLNETPTETPTGTAPATATPAPGDGAAQPAFSYTLRGKGTVNVQDLCAGCMGEIESLLASHGRAVVKPRRGRPRVAASAAPNGKRRGRPPGSKNKVKRGPGRPLGSGKKRRGRRAVEASA